MYTNNKEDNKRQSSAHPTGHYPQNPQFIRYLD